MPKISMDYSKCCIYKIEHINDESLVYVGHTTNFNKRKAQHKSSCKKETCEKFNFKLYQMIRENGGWDMFKMIEVEKISCNDRREAEKKENEVIKQLKANMNMRQSFLTEKEVIKKKKEYFKEYYDNNAEKFNMKHKLYYEKNKEEIIEYSKEYRKNNLEHVKLKEKQYREKNKEKINEKVKCQCGCEIAKQYLKSHQATKKHIKLMNKIIGE